MYSSSWSHLNRREASPCIIFKGMPNGRVNQDVPQVDSNAVCTMQKNAWMDQTAFLYWTESIWYQFSLSNQPTCLLMGSCAVHETAATKETLGNHGTKVLYIPRALQVAFKFSTLASTARSSTTFDKSLRLLCYRMVKKLNDCTSFDG